LSAGKLASPKLAEFALLGGSFDFLEVVLEVAETVWHMAIKKPGPHRGGRAFVLSLDEK
jgi:hypothetical protein